MPSVNVCVCVCVCVSECKCVKECHLSDYNADTLMCMRVRLLPLARSTPCSSKVYVCVRVCACVCVCVYVCALQAKETFL